MRINEDKAKKIVQTVVGNLENKKDFLEAEVNIDNNDYIITISMRNESLPSENILYRYISFKDNYYDIYKKD